MIQLTLLSKLDTFNRILACRDTFLSKIVTEAFGLAAFEPLILVYLNEDIEHAAREAKKIRLMDEIHHDEKLPRFPSFEDYLEPTDFAEVDSRTFGLADGRPRVIDAELLLAFIVANSAIALTSRSGYDRMIESEVFGALFEIKDISFPARSTIGKYLELTSERTLFFIQDALYRKVQAEGLDNFLSLTIDSTSIAAHSAWPTDSGLILGFLSRIHRLLELQVQYTQVDYESKLIDRWLADIEREHKAIQLLPSSADRKSVRRKHYVSLFDLAEKASGKLRYFFESRIDKINACCILPSLRLRVDRIIEQLNVSFDNVEKAITCGRLRVLKDEKVAASAKVYSLSDPDAYMIVKGDREPVLGYKPQLGRSGNGFITCSEVLSGNPADSSRLEPMVRQALDNTGVLPVTISTDDGYSSAANLAVLQDMKVQQISFSGAKGRTILGEDLWNLPEYSQLRNDRSAVESMMFTFKHKFSMRRFSRHGLDGVRKDLAEAVIAFNLWRMAYVRKQKHESRIADATAA
jgi:hypothetical protein